MPIKESEMQKLAHLTAELNTKSDELNTLIQALDTRLTSMNAGVTVWLDCPVLAAGKFMGDLPDIGLDWNYPGHLKEGYNLGYARVGDEWHIAVQYTVWEVTTDEDGDEQIVEHHIDYPQTLLSASRLVRLEAAAVLDVLVREIMKRVEIYLSDIERTREALEGENDNE